MKIAVLLSGGVDSSVALRLLAAQGEHEITAFYLKVWLEEEMVAIGDCPWMADVDMGRVVCDQLGIRFEVISCQQEYWQVIVDHAIAELKAGRTPSPDILCNQHIKFGFFYRMFGAEFDQIATGHYARIKDENGRFHLMRAADRVKDQTYFLYRLNQEQLSRCLFPIGHLHKAEVRTQAAQFNLPNQSRKDSQGLCFLGKIKYNEFVKFHLGEKTGNLIDIDTGKKVGEHRGYWYYTIGQRQGLGLGGGPWYVVQKDIEANTIFISHQERYQDQARSDIRVSSVHWIVDPPLKATLQAKIRHTPKLVDCSIEITDKDDLMVTLAQPDSGVASGQSIIFYDGEYCLGGGVID